MGRKLGQHFLARRSVLERTANELGPRRRPLVLEIGPGEGALTEYLLEAADRVVAVEVDPVLVDRLRERFRGVSRLQLVCADVLGVDLAQWGPLAVTGNLPYYISSPILAKTLALGPLLQVAVFLLQQEVAARLIAAPGSRDYGLLSVRTQVFSRVRILARVPPDAFRPPPRVGSALVRLDPRPEPLVADPEEFLRFAGLCFRHKRKTLRNNLAGPYRRELVDTFPGASLRAEQLSVEQLRDLYRKLQRGS